jgi:hypothetical protein
MVLDNPKVSIPSKRIRRENIRRVFSSIDLVSKDLSAPALLRGANSAQQKNRCTEIVQTGAGR